ncbi:MAG TPA: hypothetical protein VF062_08735 [Candidatus Limnocylindrales bacterium]
MAWEVKSDDERDHWDFVPFVNVGPLRFGMSCSEVDTALAEPGEAGASFPCGASEIPYDQLTTYFRDNGQLFCVAINALVGPQVTMDGTALVGRVPSDIEQWAFDYIERHGLGLEYTHAGDPHLLDLGLILRVQRAGDIVLSRPVFLADREEVCGDRVLPSWDYVPLREWISF